MDGALEEKSSLQAETTMLQRSLMEEQQSQKDPLQQFVIGEDEEEEEEAWFIPTHTHLPPPPREMMPSYSSSDDEEDDEEAYLVGAFEEELINVFETIPECEEEEEETSTEDDELDFTNADAAIDKMLDELQSLSRELSTGISEINKGCVDMLSPVQKQFHPPLLDDTKVDLLRSQSMASIEDVPDVDLDGILEDLCAMEENESIKNTLKRKFAAMPSAEKNEATTLHSNVNETTPSALLRSVSFSSTLTHDVKERLETLQTELQSKELSPEEQQVQLKAEKMKIALEKMKAASFQELFIKVYNSNERTSKTILVNQTWKARDLRNKMAAKDNVEPGLFWSVVEKLPELYLERILEDSEYVLQTVLDWGRDTENTLLFLQRREKYILFRNPKNFLIDLTTVDGEPDEDLAQKSKEIILKEFFTKESTTIPKTPKCLLWLKEGQKKWVKHYFSLRVSGIYYTPKGKQMSNDMTCLASFEHMNVYQCVPGFKKKFKSPTEHVFCLKHPKVQTMKSKHIFCFCAESAKMREYWMVMIRMAKYGYTMYENYMKTEEELEVILSAMSNNNIPARVCTNVDLEDESILGLDRRRSSKRGNNNTAPRVEGKRNTLRSIFAAAWSKGVESREATKGNDPNNNNNDENQELSPVTDTYFNGLCGRQSTEPNEPKTTPSGPIYETMTNGQRVAPPPRPLQSCGLFQNPPETSPSELTVTPVYEEIEKRKTANEMTPVLIHTHPSTHASEQPQLPEYGKILKTTKQ